MRDVATKHPEITRERQDEWRLMHDADNGESAVKARAEAYLPKPGGFKAQADGGKAMYDAYRARAQFPEILAPSISAMVGIIHSKKARIELPPAMEYLLEQTTATGLSLFAFHRRITRQLLKMGRFAVLADAPADSGQPFLAGYHADSIINWENDGSFYVLDETGMVRDGFEWNRVEQYRVLELVNGVYQ